MKISRNSFVKKYKALKNCNKQTALLKWEKLLLHFGFDVSLKTLKFGMDNNNNNNNALVQQQYIGYIMDNDNVVVVNSVNVAVGEVKKLDNQTYRAINFIWGPSVTIVNNVPIEYQNIQDALNSLGFGNIQPVQYPFGNFRNSRLQDASLVLNYDYLNKCTEYQTNVRRGRPILCQPNKLVHDVLRNTFATKCAQQLQRYLQVDAVEFRICIGTNDYYFNFHQKGANQFPLTTNGGIDDTANAPTTTRKYHLTFHVPPTTPNSCTYAYHFKIEQLPAIDNNGNPVTTKTCLNLVFDIVSQKLNFQEIPNLNVPFPINDQNVTNVLDCLKKNLNEELLYGDTYDNIEPINYKPSLMNHIKGMISSQPAMLKNVKNRINALENRINDRRLQNVNNINNNDKIRQFQFQTYSNNEGYLQRGIQQGFITRHDIEDMFFIKGLREYPTNLRQSLWPRTNVF